MAKLAQSKAKQGPIRHSLELVEVVEPAPAAAAAKRKLELEEDDIPKRRYKPAYAATQVYSQQSQQKSSQKSQKPGLYKTGVFADVEDIDDSDSESSDSDSESSSGSSSEDLYQDPRYTSFAFESLKHYGPSSKYVTKKKYTKK